MDQELVVIQGKVFDVIGINELVISELNKQYLPLKINGIDDKEGYRAAHEGLMKYVKARTMVEKHGKATREKAVKFQKDVIAEEKRVVGLLAPGEEHLRAERQTVDDELAAIKAAEEKLIAIKIQERVDRICAMGAMFNGQLYLAHGIMIIPDIIKGASDQDFDALIAQIQAEKDAEDAKNKAAEAARKVEEERLKQIAADQEAERQRLAETQKRQTEEAARIKAEQIEAERVRLQSIAEEERKARVKERLEAEERERKAAEIRAEAERVRKEKEEWEAIKAQEARDIAAAKQKVIDDAKHAEEIETARIRAVEQARIDIEAKIKRQVEEKAAADLRAKIAAEKKEARRPDKAKLKSYINTIFSIPEPEMKTEEGKAVQKRIDEALESMNASMNAWIEEL